MDVVSRFMSNPGKEHWEVVKWSFRYLKSTSKAVLCFKNKDFILERFSRANLGGITVCWMSRLQKGVAFSTVSTKYMTISEASKVMSC